MKIKLFTIPNILTLANLLCGTLAVFEVVAHQNFTSAFWLIIIAALFDFCDGLAARLLKCTSPLGLQLDSLSDMVSFGLVPTLVMSYLYNINLDSVTIDPLLADIGQYAILIMVLFSALRLARFNCDTENQKDFIGLPTPANALFCLSLGLLFDMGMLDIAPLDITFIAIIMSVMLILPVKMFSLKFHGGVKENLVRYIFLAVSLITVITLREIAIPILVMLYIFTSLIISIVNRLRAL